MAMSAMAQGLSIHQNAIMELYADIARQGIANRVAYSPYQELPVVNHGQYSTVTIAQMALTATINVKSVLAKKVNAKMVSTSALTLLGTLANVGISPDGIARLSQLALMDVVSRTEAASFVRPQGPSQQELATAQLQGQNMAKQLAQNQQMYLNNPMSYEAENVMQTQSPEDIDAIIGALSQGQVSAIEPETSNLGAAGDTLSVSELDMQEQPGAMAADLSGLTVDSGSQLANPNSLVG